MFMNYPNQLDPRQALNKAFLRVKPGRNEIEVFKKNLVYLLDHIDENESEEFHKNLVRDFLRSTWYHPDCFVNTKGRSDLVVHNGKTANSSVGIIIETKKPGNKTEMIRQGNLNTKAFQELLLYFLRERVINKNLEIKHLIATDIYTWYFFDVQALHKLVLENKSLVKHYTDFEENRLTGTGTDFFYREIASPFIESVKEEIEYTKIDIRDYEKVLRGRNHNDDRKLITIFKLLSPQHLLKLPFANDSNTLDRKFYTELLHIIGLQEIKKGNRVIIGRKKVNDRLQGSLIENTILQLESLGKLARLPKQLKHGKTQDEVLFNTAIELVITWVNRILFLKLLEAQLVGYHRGDKTFSFLNLKMVPGFDHLNRLFFSVLAVRQPDRMESVRQQFKNVPYLNSSLFEPSEIEHHTLFVSNLMDEYLLPVFHSTVLKDNTGKKRNGNIRCLDYLFSFLDAYDFSSEGSEDIQEENKTLINASVLGLIFEKINGYKEGAVFTPGFITMYMCSESIRTSVLQKFNSEKGWNCKDFDDLYNKITDRKEANNIINSIKICDPAVGSGHFLVSALNEIIALKSDLNLLIDRNGRWLKEYKVEIVNDELIVTDDYGEIFQYHPENKEKQRFQEALFHEKQTIIENCLFGVDINPNSVKICQLRLWIELLKNAYYRIEPDVSDRIRELETLPNIDINIKTGNSLVSRFSLDADLRKSLKSIKWNIGTYRDCVRDYKHATNKEQKRALESLIREIKSDFQTGIGREDPKRKRLNRLTNELYHRFTGNFLFEPESGYGGFMKKDHKNDKERIKLEKEIEKISHEIEVVENNHIFESALEWRFEFPEVLTDEGDFAGFDMVIGNPPYIRAEELGYMKDYFRMRNKVYSPGGDMFSYFYELGHSLLKQGGTFCFISNTFDKTVAGKSLRDFIASGFDVRQYIDFTSVNVFEDATTYPVIILAVKNSPVDAGFTFRKIEKSDFSDKKKMYQTSRMITLPQSSLLADHWSFASSEDNDILEKIRMHKTIRDIYGKCYRGILTGLNEAFILNRKISDSEILKPVLEGKDIKKWHSMVPEKWMIAFESKSTRLLFGEGDVGRFKTKMVEFFPEIFSHLLPFEERAVTRLDKGEFWWELRNCAYYNLFQKPKIIFPNLQNTNKFSFDTTGAWINAPAVFLPTSDKYLLAILNSKLIWYFLSGICVVRNGGFIEVKPQYFEQIPLPETDDDMKESLSLLVDQIINYTHLGKISEAKSLEQEIDEIVYSIYNLDIEERLVINDNPYR
jgi:adenine-specific DNA-methyltransferase